MNFGALFKNNFGSVLVDDTYPQPFLVASGTLAATALVSGKPDYVRALVTVSTGQNISGALLQVRAAISTSVVVDNISDTTFRYSANGSVDWRLYSTVPQTHTPSGYGMVVRNSVGGIVYDSTYPSPSVHQTATISNPASFTGSDTVLATWTVSERASDGGLPFFNASAVMPTGILASYGGQIVSALALVFTSSTQADLHHRPYFMAGNPYVHPASMSQTNFGQTKRTFLFTR